MKFVVFLGLSCSLFTKTACLSEEYYAVAPKNTAAVRGDTLMMSCKSLTVVDPQHAWLDYILTENGHRIALNEGLATGVDPAKYYSTRLLPPVPVSTELYIYDIEYTDVAKYACRLVSSNVWAFSYVVMLDTRPMCGDVNGSFTTEGTIITVLEHDEIDLGCEISYYGNFQPTLDWDMPSMNADNMTSTFDNETLTLDVTLNATEAMNERSLSCIVSFKDGKGLDEEPDFPADVNITEYARAPPEFTDTCTITLDVHFSPRGAEVSVPNDTYHANMTLQIGEYLNVTARANPPALYTWSNVTETNDVTIQNSNQQLEMTVDMVGWNRYATRISNTVGAITHMVEFYVAPEPTTAPPFVSTTDDVMTTEDVMTTDDGLSTVMMNYTIDDCIILSCDLNMMHVTLDIPCFVDIFPETDPYSLTLEDVTCYGDDVNNGSSLEWVTHFGDCSTRKEESADFIEFTNMLIDYVMDQTGVIIIDYTWKMNLSCFMSRDAVASRELRVIPKRRTFLYKEEKTLFNLSMTFFHDETYAVELVDSPLYVDLGGDLFVQVKMVDADSRLRLILDDVIGYSESDISSANRYELVKDKCVQNNSTVIINSTRDSVRFSFKAFRFVSGGDMLYLRATALVCDQTDAACDAACGTVSLRRERRHAQTQTDYLNVLRGPIVTSRGAGKISYEDSHKNPELSSGSHVVIFGSVALVVMVPMVALVTVLRTRMTAKRRPKSRDHIFMTG